MEQPAEMLPASDYAIAFERRGFRIYQPITEPLMVSLAMVVRCGKQIDATETA
jgi:hypothetical protein